MRESLERLRKVLAERHIGIVLVGFLAYYAVLQAIEWLNDPFANLLIGFYNQHRPPDTFEVGSQTTLPAAFIFGNLFSVFVLIYLSVLIYWWIFGRSDEAATSGEGS